MRAIWKIILSTATSEPAVIHVEGAVLPLRVRRSAAVRSAKLSVDATRGEVRLSLPPRASLRRALVWAQEQAPWVAAQLAVRPVPVAFADGAIIPLEGVDTRIEWRADARRAVIRQDDRLLIGGPPESLAPRLTRWLHAEAKRILTADTLALAATHGLTVASVGVGDTRSRWGSCTSRGAIRYSWRLLLCPPDIRRATVAHELAHLLHMDHSPAFHAAHARILGADPRPARAWLRAHGAGLHRYG